MCARRNNRYKRNKYYALIVSLLIMLPMYYLSSGFIFFWGWYLFCLLMLMIIFLPIIGFCIIKIKAYMHKSSKNTDIKSRKKNNTQKKQSIKIKDLLLVIVISALVLMLYVYTIKEVVLMTLDLPNVINEEYTTSRCIIERVSRESKRHGHAQYITIRDINTNQLIKIEFQHRYRQLYAHFKYEVRYLPHSKIGVDAYITD